MNIKRTAAKPYVKAESAFGLNTLSYNTSVGKFEFYYGTVPELISARNAINGNQTSEGMALSLFDDLNVDAVMDIGAHHGIYSVIMGVLNPTAQLYAYEPASPPRDVLWENLKLNNLSDANVVTDVVTGRSGETVTFEEDDSPTSERHAVVEGSEGIKKQTVALSDVFKEEGVESAFLKIDAEGQEGEIVEDLVSVRDTTLQGIIEIHPDKLDGRTSDGIKDLFTNHGFDYKFICESTPDYKHSRPIYGFA